MRRIPARLLAALCVLLLICLAVPGEGEDIDIRERLRGFGYTIGEEYSAEETAEALRSFQIRTGLRVTGVADEMTVLLLTELPTECSCIVEGEKKIYHLPAALFWRMRIRRISHTVMKLRIRCAMRVFSPAKCVRPERSHPGMMYIGHTMF